MRTELLVDAPDASITSYAETEGCDLIVIAASIFVPLTIVIILAWFFLRGAKNVRFHQATVSSVDFEGKTVRTGASGIGRGERVLRV